MSSSYPSIRKKLHNFSFPYFLLRLKWWLIIFWCNVDVHYFIDRIIFKYSAGNSGMGGRNHSSKYNKVNQQRKFHLLTLIHTHHTPLRQVLLSTQRQPEWLASTTWLPRPSSSSIRTITKPISSTSTHSHSPTGTNSLSPKRKFEG